MRQAIDPIFTRGNKIGRRRGLKKINAWQFKRPDSGDMLMIDVYMTMPEARRRGRRSDDETGAKTKFVAFTGTEVEERHESASIDTLRELVKKAIAAIKPFTWTRKIVFEVETDHDPFKRRRAYSRAGRPAMHLDASASITLKIETIEIAETNGRKIRRGVNDDGSPDSRHQDGWPEVGNIKTKWSRGSARTTISMIDDTPENRAALQAVLNMIDHAGTRLRNLATPDMITATLAQALAGSARLLPGPADAPAIK